MFKNRSYEKELLDAEVIPRADLHRNLKELDFINTWLGGHAITIKGIKKFVNGGVLSIADVGCGGGDNLKAIAIWARKRGLELKLIGIDLKLDCVEYAQRNCKEFPEISFINSDYKKVDMQFDVIMSALFCHHLNDDEMVEYLVWCSKHAKNGFFINDLERNPLAHYSIKILTYLFSRSYLVKNDAPLSVLRGFSRTELCKLFSLAEIKKYTIEWKWVFRYLIFSPVQTNVDAKNNRII